MHDAVLYHSLEFAFSILCCAEEQAGQAWDRSDHSISCAASQATTMLMMMMIVATMTMTMTMTMRRWRRIINLANITMVMILIIEKKIKKTNHLLQLAIMFWLNITGYEMVRLFWDFKMVQQLRRARVRSTWKEICRLAAFWCCNLPNQKVLQAAKQSVVYISAMWMFEGSCTYVHFRVPMYTYVHMCTYLHTCVHVPRCDEFSDIWMYLNIFRYKYSCVSYSYNFSYTNIFGYLFVSFFYTNIFGYSFVSFLDKNIFEYSFVSKIYIRHTLGLGWGNWLLPNA